MNRTDVDSYRIGVPVKLSSVVAVKCAALKCGWGPCRLLLKYIEISLGEENEKSIESGREREKRIRRRRQNKVKSEGRFYMVTQNHFNQEGSTLGWREILQNVAQGSQTLSKIRVLSWKMLTIFSCAMIQDILCFNAMSWTEVLFQWAAIVILVPNKMKKISACVYLSALFILRLRSAMSGVWGTCIDVILRIKENTLFRRPLMRGHDHQICSIVPISLHFLKQSGKASGYILAKREGAL